MTTPAITADVALSLADVQQLMERRGVHHLPIVREELLVGMIAQDDLNAVQPVEARLRPYEWRALLAQIAVADWLVGEPLQIGPRVALLAAAQLMVARDVSAITVTVAHRPIGVITASDLLRPLIFGGRGGQVEDPRRQRRVCARCGAISHVRLDQREPLVCWSCGERLVHGNGSDERAPRVARFQQAVVAPVRLQRSVQ
jgi:DNA-directed RNA polymerase subunit RPC12/RpoP